MTKLKLKAYRYTQSIYAGPIIIPRRHASVVVKGVARMNNRTIAPQVSMDLFVARKEQLAHRGAVEDLFLITVYDALGEEHAKSEDGFKWALDIPDAVVMATVMDLRRVSQMHGEQISHQQPFSNFAPAIGETVPDEGFLLQNKSPR